MIPAPTMTTSARSIMPSPSRSMRSIGVARPAMVAASGVDDLELYAPRTRRFHRDHALAHHQPRRARPAARGELAAQLRHAGGGESLKRAVRRWRHRRELIDDLVRLGGGRAIGEALREETRGGRRDGLSRLPREGIDPLANRVAREGRRI